MRLIATFASRKTPLDLTIVHADTPTLLAHLASHDVAAQVAIYMRLTNRLAAAGAGCVAITSIGGHFCVDAFAAASPLPVVNMIGEVNRAIEQRGFRRVGILGTRTVMNTRFYGGVSTATVVSPSGQDLDDVHEAYVAMASAGVVTEAQRAVFEAAIQRLLQDEGAEAIVLGGTDLALAFDERTSTVPLIDCAGIHADAIARLALPG